VRPIFHLIEHATLFFLAVVLIFEYVQRRQRQRTLSKESWQDKQKQPKQNTLTQELNNLKKELARKGEIADRLPQIIKAITEKLPPAALPAIVVRYAKEFFHARQVGFFVPVQNSNDYTLEVGVGFPADWKGMIRLPAGGGILGVALQQKLVVARVDSLSSSGPSSPRPCLEQLGVSPDFVAPVFGVIGIIGVLVIAGCPLSIEGERKYVSMLADLMSSSLQKDLLIESGKNSVWVDHLTGVANRLYFLQRFESEIRRTENYKQALALFLFDIDEFKKINDTHGHVSGDIVIKKVTEIVRSNTRSSDLVGRYGGDEFTVLITSTTQEQAFTYADNLRKKISDAEIRIPGHDAIIRMTISGGLAVFPTHGMSTSELIIAADYALYDAKRKGRNRTILAQSVGLGGALEHEQLEVQRETTPGIQEKEAANEASEYPLDFVADRLKP
jgi:diguanylate cyclase (GGDEF)-like protein